MNFTLPKANLTLQLRSSAFTVQSLGPSSDPWNESFSFVRTLAGAALPSQMQ